MPIVVRPTPPLTHNQSHSPVVLPDKGPLQNGPPEDGSPQSELSYDDHGFDNGDLGDPFFGNLATVNPAPSQLLRGRPTIIPGFEGQPRPFVIPDIIRKKMEKGWCSDLKIRGQQYTVDDTTNTLVSVDKPLVDTDENWLSFNEWQQAWPRFLKLISMYLPSIHSMWKKHYKRILMAPDQASNWYTWHNYDIKIRKQSLHIPIDPKHFHQRIWNHIDAENLRKHAMQLPQCSTPRPGPIHHHYQPNLALHRPTGDLQPIAFSVETPVTAPENALQLYKSMAVPLSSSAQALKAGGVMDRDSPSVSPSMAYLAAAPLTATGSIGAPYARTLTMGRKCVLPSEFHPIITPLIADAWEQELHQYRTSSTPLYRPLFEIAPQTPYWTFLHFPIGYYTQIYVREFLPDHTRFIIPPR
ncbi:hypothetical protein P691DRAFT_791465 [Macrolepiota fuliginosa MF-IS2]|uniref:Uncharacterized protein n=1 Tax=Macrolepiota fuliginosa MF-IS2 TaxID=1400762 RepID=A0A9P5WYC4_9AGAR|nr:hypothetical protein P691DRAFT_791465 [Macrolepiota fuliginosa MF-IS2]